jgi:hypothetical protein
VTETPHGYCECGCGQRTRLAPRTRPDAGWVEGRPLRYVRGHIHALKTHHEPQDCGYETPCWVWQGTRIDKGYGRINRGGRETFAHIYEWEKVNGPVPEGLELDHLCRNPACCNPEHLEAVTHAENMRRAARCVMTPDSVAEVRRLLATGATGRSIAHRLGVHERIVSSIKCGKAWVGVG